MPVESYAPVVHILPLTLIRRERTLPVGGKILVRKGQRVNPTDIVAEVNLHTEHILIDVARNLAVSTERAETLIRCQAGDHLAPGDLIAGPVGIFRRVVRASQDCQVILTGNGQVLLEMVGQPYQLKAGIAGEVVELISDCGVIVETAGLLIQGVWGNGRIGYGVLSMLARDANHHLTASELDVSLRGSIVVAGYCQDREALESAETLPVRGLVLSSLSSALIYTALKMSVPVIVLEGFGERTFNPVSLKLLTTSNRREVSVDARQPDPVKGLRPEIVVSLPSSGSPPLPRDVIPFEIDQQVRIISNSRNYEPGVIISLPGYTTLSNGVRAEAAEVRLEDGKILIVPLANLEVLA